MDYYEYSNLHHKTHYSCGIGIGKCSEAIQVAKEGGISSLAITDYATLSGVWDFIKEGQKQDYPVIIGTELNVYWDYSQNYQIVLLVKNQAGYHNLCKILSFAYKNLHLFQEPTCSIADLTDFSDGLVLLTGNINGVFGKDYLTTSPQEAYKKANRRIRELYAIYGSDLYLEMTLANEMYQWDQEAKDYVKKYETNPQQIVNKHIIEYGRRTGIPYLLSGDSVIPRQEDKPLQDVIVRNTEKGKDGFFIRENRHLLNPQELRARSALFGISEKAIKESCLASRDAARKCENPDLQFQEQLVDFPIITHPLYEEGMGKLELVNAIIMRSGRMPWADSTYTERLKYEIQVICHNGKINLIDYFLVLEDLCRWCRENGIVVGPGRGSGAGSLLNYLLHITHLDPIKNGLLFERFISEARILKGTYPDIDLDFSDQKAAKAYLGERYGWDRVKPIATFQTMRTKTAIKDAFKLFYPDVPFTEINKFTTSFPKKEELESEVEYYERSLIENPSIDQVLNHKFPKAGETVERMIGFNRQTGIHPCGMAITKDPLSHLAPVRFMRGREYLDFNLDACEQIGIIKFDVLSISTLKYIDTCAKQIKERHGIDIDIYNLPLDDKETLENFSKGDTESVFQFNSDVAKSILTQIKIESLEDLCLVTSAGRPGPMKNLQHLEFIKRKNGDKKPEPPHWKLKEVLKETYGIMMYQESVMQASVILGGFTLAEADDIRKGMGKKKKSVLEPYKKRFIENCTKYYDPDGSKYGDDVMAQDQIENEGGHTDISPQKAEELWHLMETFAGYGFNKSHSMAYAEIGYICQYLKTHYPMEWWFACLKHSVDKTEKFNTYFTAARDYVLMPDINQSTDDFFINGEGKIVLPFSVVKGVGEKANIEIDAHRPYTSFEHFYKTVKKRTITKTVVERLIWAGAFDCFNVDKEELIQQYYKLRNQKLPEEYQHIDRTQFVLLQKKSLDFLLVDYYELYDEVFTEDLVKYAHQIEELRNKAQVILGGKVGKVKVAKTRKGDQYATFPIENKSQEVMVKLWPEEFQENHQKIKEGAIIKLRGSINYWNGQPQVIGSQVWNLEEALRIANYRRTNEQPRT